MAAEISCSYEEKWRTPAGRSQDGDLRDVVLSAGEAFDFDRRGEALLNAFADSRYLLLEACAAQPH